MTTGHAAQEPVTARRGGANLGQVYFLTDFELPRSVLTRR
jgi:hypothetical protein